ncbi:MAG: DUF58 domain-containing protein [Acidobacteria bacterium]|nr:DUF58 domain-containing protein [Acidobacteriota bacterium]
MSWWEKSKRWRRPALSVLLVLGGVCAALVTVVARRGGDWELARLGAISSLVFAGLIVLFVVPPLARSARAEAARLDLPFQLTSGGLVFLCIYATVAFAAWNTGNNLLFLVFSVLTSSLFVAWSAGRASLRDLVVSARFPDHIFAGEPAPIIVSVHNLKRVLPSFSVVVESRSRADAPGGGRVFRWKLPRQRKRVLAYFMYVPHGARVEQRVEQTFAERGHVLVTGFEISTRFPFGVFRLRRRLRARDVEIVVYPKLEAASDELHLLPIDAGQMPSRRSGAGTDLHSLREYQPQDDMRHIDWKATARQKRLVVREFTADDERRVHVVLDTFVEGREAAGGGDDGTGAGAEAELAARFERGVTHAASLAAHFIDESAELRLTLGEEAGQYGAGREHLYECLRRLALIAPRRESAAAPRRAEFWERISPSSPTSGYVILLTTAAPGTIPAFLWRKSHVIHP